MAQRSREVALLPNAGGLCLPGKWTETGLELPKGLPFEEWLSVMKIIERVEGSTRWVEGDSILFGEAEYGDEHQQGLDPERASTQMQCQWVSNAFDKLRRRKSLSWSHHYEVSGMEVQEQERWLNWADTPDENGKRKSRHELRKAIRDERETKLRKTLERWQPPKVWCESWETWLPKQPECDLLLTDPPYATDVDNIDQFAAEWLPVALGKVKPSGRAYVCIGAYPHEIDAYLHADHAGLNLANILVWTYRNTLGPSPKDNYKLNWQAILYFVGPEAPPLNCDIMVEQFSVQDIAAPDGRHLNREHEWQKPDELGERFIRHSTKPGALVLDPFVCTGTFVLAANRLGRVGLGCDISLDNLRISEKRGCVIAE